MSVKDAVAKRFIELLKERDMNVNQLAIISGVTASTVYSLLDESRRDVSIVRSRNGHTFSFFNSQTIIRNQCIVIMIRKA